MLPGRKSSKTRFRVIWLICLTAGRYLTGIHFLRSFMFKAVSVGVLVLFQRQLLFKVLAVNIFLGPAIRLGAAFQWVIYYFSRFQYFFCRLLLQLLSSTRAKGAPEGRSLWCVLLVRYWSFWTSVKYSLKKCWRQIIDPAHEIMVLITWATSEGSGESRQSLCYSHT